MIIQRLNRRSGIILLLYAFSIVSVFVSIIWIKTILLIWNMGVSQGWTIVISSPQIVDLNIELTISEESFINFVSTIPS